MLFALLVPEILPAKATGDLVCAWTLTEQLGSRVTKDGVQWSKVHTFFSNMGGFVIQFDDDTAAENLNGPGDSRDETHECSCETSSAETERDCEKAVATKKSDIYTTTPKTPRMMTNDDKRMCRLITIREKALPPADNKNGFLVRKVMSDLKRRIV